METLFEIINEEDYDEYTEVYSYVSGCNIKTGCYGLFLIASDDCTTTYKKNVLKLAMELLYQLDDTVVVGALHVFFPPDDLSTESIIKLAKAVIKLHTLVGSSSIINVPDVVYDKFAKYTSKHLVLKNELQQLTTIGGFSE